MWWTSWQRPWNPSSSCLWESRPQRNHGPVWHWNGWRAPTFWEPCGSRTTSTSVVWLGRIYIVKLKIPAFLVSGKRTPFEFPSLDVREVKNLEDPQFKESFATFQHFQHLQHFHGLMAVMTIMVPDRWSCAGTRLVDLYSSSCGWCVSTWSLGRTPMAGGKFDDVQIQLQGKK